MNRVVAAVVVVGLAGGAGWWFLGRGDHAGSADVRFRTAKVERGEVLEGVQASGAVQPVLLVQVGTQVSGTIDKLFADFNSKVKAGQTIALLDTRRLEAQVTQDEASVARATADLERMKAVVLQSKAEADRAEATLAQSRADIDRVKALLTQAQRDLERQRTLAEKRLVSPSDVDIAVASTGSLGAQLVSAEAAVRQNEAQVASARATIATNEAQLAVGAASIRQSEALLKGDRVNLDYATIVSPIDGVVVSRNVDVGQTVAASLSAPTLFVIANDLTKIQVQASVPEADVGKLHEGQKARFQVDAHQDRFFDGVVSQVRLASATVQNVVTYTVLVDASNPEGLLLPGMTATVVFEIARSAKDAMTVPATALRLQAPADLLDAAPAPESPKPADGAAGAEASPGGEKPQRNGGQPGSRGGKGGRKPRMVVYVQTPANRLHAIPVKAGISDGIRTVVEPIDPASLPEGTEVVTSVLRDETPATTNPFAPPRMGGPSTRGTGVR
jgi:HlyD family secretion protein